ncbi:MAG: FecR domain-containing protein [Gallionellaceae bacterium]|jgi:hypothetical protein
MKREMNVINILTIYLLVSLMLVSQTSYAADAGHAQFVNGSVQITSATGQTSILKKGDAVKEGDTLTTAKTASAQIKMLDGGLIAVRPDTNLKFDIFKFNGTQDGSERSFFSLFTGGFRAVTGLIGQLNKSNFRITTATATIGIRGTDHETFVVTADSPLAAVVPIGTYNKVNRGETTMTTTKGTISVLPNQMGFVGAADQMPELKPLNTSIFTVSDRPLTGANSDKKEGKEAREAASPENSAAKEAAPRSASASGKDSDTNTDTSAPTRILTDGTGKNNRTGVDISSFNNGGKNDPSDTLAGVISVPADTNNDPDKTINWGRWNNGIKVTNQLNGEFTGLTLRADKSAAVDPTGTAAAKLPETGILTHTNANAAGTTSTNNPGATGGNAIEHMNNGMANSHKL